MQAHDGEIADFQQHQLAFTHWIRHPQTAAIPEQIESRRMQTYRDLVFNNVSSFIEHTYPIAQAMLPSTVWDTLVDYFFKYGQCDSPYYYDISLHFREYLDQARQEEPAEQSRVMQVERDTVRHDIQQIHLRYPWLQELLQYEWMELYVDMAETSWRDDSAAIERAGLAATFKFKTLNKNVPITLKTSCWLLAYQYPVHTWSKDAYPVTPESLPTCLLIFRNPDFQMRVFTLHPLWAYLIELIQSAPEPSIHQLAHALAIATQYSEKAAKNQVKTLIKWLFAINLLQIRMDSFL